MCEVSGTHACRSSRRRRSRAVGGRAEARRTARPAPGSPSPPWPGIATARPKPARPRSYSNWWQSHIQGKMRGQGHKYARSHIALPYTVDIGMPHNASRPGFRIAMSIDYTASNHPGARIWMRPTSVESVSHVRVVCDRADAAVLVGELEQLTRVGRQMCRVRRVCSHTQRMYAISGLVARQSSMVNGLSNRCQGPTPWVCL